MAGEARTSSHTSVWGKNIAASQGPAQCSRRQGGPVGGLTALAALAAPWVLAPKARTERAGVWVLSTVASVFVPVRTAVSGSIVTQFVTLGCAHRRLPVSALGQWRALEPVLWSCFGGK